MQKNILNFIIKLINYRSKIFLVFWPSYVLLLLSCKMVTKTNDDLQNFQIIDYNINILNYEDLPYLWGTPVSLEDFPMDSSGILIYEKGDQFYYHPVDLAQKILLFLSSYRLTGDSRYIAKSESFIDKLQEISVKYKDALYYPYLFTWDLHGIPGETMNVPWYSGMAQGQILTAAIRLFKITNDSLYFDLATKTFNSFKYLKDDFVPWVVFMDEDNYYWIEEYPADFGRTKALNGFIFGIYGLYEYYLLTRNQKCEILLKAAITTIQKYVHLYRNPGDISYYCLRHKMKYRNYHLYHTEQLLMLYKITGDEFFKNEFINFYNDTH